MAYKHKSPAKFYTVQQTAALLQVHWQSVLNYIKRGELGAVKIGKGYRVSDEALDSFLKRHSTKRGKS